MNDYRPRFSWEVHYYLERRWLRWRVHASYSLINPPDRRESHSIQIDLPGRYWLKTRAHAELKVAQFVAQYGEPQPYVPAVRRDRT